MKYTYGLIVIFSFVFFAGIISKSNNAIVIGGLGLFASIIWAIGTIVPEPKCGNCETCHKKETIEAKPFSDLEKKN